MHNYLSLINFVCHKYIAPLGEAADEGFRSVQKMVGTEGFQGPGHTGGEEEFR